MQDELDDISVRILLRNKAEKRNYEEIKDEMRAMHRRSGDEDRLGVVQKYPAPKFLKTDWSDLMLWAVCQGEIEIAQSLWVKTREPLRYAVWASQIAGHLSHLENTANGQEEWRELALQYENWAVELLAECPLTDHELAAKMLCLTMESMGREQSAMDDATDPMSTQWRSYTLISAPHARTLVLQAFDGDYPGSNIRIVPSTKQVGWWQIALQILVFVLMLPIKIVDLQMRVNIDDDDNSTTRGDGGKVEMDARAMQKSRTMTLPEASTTGGGDDDDDDDETDGETDGGEDYSKSSSSTRKRRNSRKKSSKDLREDDQNITKTVWTCCEKVTPLSRLALFLRIPRVTFFLRFVCYTAYVILFVYKRVGILEAAPWMTSSGLMKVEYDMTEWILWFWSLMRFLEEFQPLLLTYEGWSRVDVLRDYVGEWQKNFVKVINVAGLLITTSMRLVIAQVQDEDSTMEDWKITLSAIQFMDAIQMIFLFFGYISMLSVFRSVRSTPPHFLCSTAPHACRYAAWDGASPLHILEAACDALITPPPAEPLSTALATPPLLLFTPLAFPLNGPRVRLS